MLLAFSLPLAADAPPPQPSDKGALVMVGGALAASTTDVYEKFIELAGGKDKAKIGIFPAASGKPVHNTNRFKDDLQRFGIPESNIAIIPIGVKDDSTTENFDESRWQDNGSDAEVVDQIKRYTGIWFLGGDQLRITKTLFKEDGGNTPALDALWEIYRNGAVLGGTSAGAAIMSEIMIGGGDSLGSLKEGFTTEYTGMDQQEYGPAYVEKGLGFFPYGTVDQHFDRKARFGRLIVINYANKDKQPKGFGIDENTALVVNNATGEAEVMGRGGVTIIDVSKATKDEKSKLTAMKDISISFIQGGDRYNLKTGEFTINPDKYPTVGKEYLAVEDPLVTGVFSRNPNLKDFITYDLIDNSKATEIKSYAFGADGIGFELTFRQTPETQGFWRTLDGQLDNYSAIDVILDIKPVQVEIKPL
jgi:cyanophycinase